MLSRSVGFARHAVVLLGNERSEAAQMATGFVSGRGGFAEQLGQGMLFSPSLLRVLGGSGGQRYGACNVNY